MKYALYIILNLASTAYQTSKDSFGTQAMVAIPFGVPATCPPDASASFAFLRPRRNCSSISCNVRFFVSGRITYSSSVPSSEMTPYTRNVPLMPTVANSVGPVLITAKKHTKLNDDVRPDPSPRVATGNTSPVNKGKSCNRGIQLASRKNSKKMESAKGIKQRAS